MIVLEQVYRYRHVQCNVFGSSKVWCSWPGQGCLGWSLADYVQAVVNWSRLR